MNHVIYLLSSADISIFSSEISKFCHIRKYICKLYFGTYFISNSLNFFESLKTFLINMVTILMVPAKLATRSLLKIQIFQNKGYDFIISDYDPTNKILLRDSNYIVDAVMKLTFGNSSVSMREVIIRSIL